MSRYGNSSGGGWLFVRWLLVLLIVILVGTCLVRCSIGTGGWGPYGSVSAATITSKHVDAGKEESNYMVNTDKGTFEVDNGLLLSLWNADDVYGSMVVGKTYNLRTKGNRVVGMFFQSYPYIISATEVAQPVASVPQTSEVQRKIDELQRQLDALKAQQGSQQGSQQVERR